MELIKQTDEIVVGTEAEVRKVIEDFKEKGREEGYDVIGYSSKRKQVKSKGEIIDEYFLIKIIKKWD